MSSHLFLRSAKSSMTIKYWILCLQPPSLSPSWPWWMNLWKVWNQRRGSCLPSLNLSLDAFTGYAITHAVFRTSNLILTHFHCCQRKWGVCMVIILHSRSSVLKIYCRVLKVESDMKDVPGRLSFRRVYSTDYHLEKYLRDVGGHASRIAHIDGVSLVIV